MLVVRASLVRSLALAIAGLALIALLAAFFLLYLRVPAGWSPMTGYAPHTARLFLGAFPYPVVSLGPRAFRIAAVSLTVATWGLYAAVAIGIARTSEPAARRALLGVTVGLCLLAHVVLVLLPPVFSTDLFRYGLFGRMVAVHGLNPYATPADALSGDPLWPYAGWRHLRSHYGAAFLWISAATVKLGGGGPVGTALAFKAVTALFNLVACWAVYRLSRETGPGDGLQALALYGLNPLILVESAGGAHPDAIMIALALVGALLWWRGRAGAGFGLLVVSAAIKYMTGTLVLLVGLHTVFNAEPGRRARVAAQLLGVAAAVLLALYLPFARGADVFGTAVQVIVRGRALERGLEAAPAATPIAALAIFGVLLLGAMVIAARGMRTYVFDLSAMLVTIFVLFAVPWWMPWYFLTGIALALVAAPTPTNRFLRLIVLFLGLLAMLLYCALVPIAGSP